MSKIGDFLNSKLVKKDVGEPTYLTWKETLSYTAGRGAQGMSTSMTASKYVNAFLAKVLMIDTDVTGRIRLYCGIFDAVNDPIMGVIVDKTRTKYGKMLPYIRVAPFFVSLFMMLFFIGSDKLTDAAKIALTVFSFVGLDVTYTAFDVPMGALAYSMTPNGVERTKLYGVASIGRAILGAIPAGLVAFAAWLPYFKEEANLGKAYLVSSAFSALFIILLTRLTFRNCKERYEHHEDTPSLKECLRLLFTNRPLFMLFLCNLIFVLVKVPEQASFFFAYDGMFAPKYNGLLDVVKAPGSFLAGIFVPMINEKLGKRADSKKFYQVCCALGVAFNLLYALTTYHGIVNKPADQPVTLPIGILVLVFSALVTFPLEFKNLMQKEMEAETVDYVEWKTGQRVEGVMLSIMSFTGKFENTFSSYICMKILSLTGYTEHDAASDSVSVVQGLKARKGLFGMTTLLPALGYLLMLVPMIFYNITGDGHRQMVKEIAERRAARGESFEDAG